MRTDLGSAKIVSYASIGPEQGTARHKRETRYAAERLVEVNTTSAKSARGSDPVTGAAKPARRDEAPSLSLSSLLPVARDRRPAPLVRVHPVGRSLLVLAR